MNNDLSKNTYIDTYVNLPITLRMCRIWKENSQKMIYKRFDELTDTEVKDCPMMLPTGLKDDEGNNIYGGDLLLVEIETKYDIIERIGVVRQEGLVCCGLDYLSRDGTISDEGDFIDEFFLRSKKIIGNIYKLDGVA